MKDRSCTETTHERANTDETSTEPECHDDHGSSSSSDGRGRSSRQAQMNVNNKQDLTQVSRHFESLDSEPTTAHSNGDYNNGIRSAHR